MKTFRGPYIWPCPDYPSAHLQEKIYIITGKEQVLSCLNRNTLPREFTGS